MRRRGYGTSGGMALGQSVAASPTVPSRKAEYGGNGTGTCGKSPYDRGCIFSKLFHRGHLLSQGTEESVCIWKKRLKEALGRIEKWIKQGSHTLVFVIDNENWKLTFPLIQWFTHSFTHAFYFQGARRPSAGPISNFISVSFKKRNQNRKWLLSFLLYPFLHCLSFYKIGITFIILKNFTSG